jgi:hypothetical protein
MAYSPSLWLMANWLVKQKWWAFYMVALSGMLLVVY